MTILFWRFLKSFFTLFYTFLHISNLGDEGVTAKLLASLEEALERSPSRLLGGLDRGARGVKGVAAKVVAGLEEALERVPDRHLERSVLGGDLVLVKSGVGGVNDDCVGRRHYDCYYLVYFITETPLLCLIHHLEQMTITGGK